MKCMFQNCECEATINVPYVIGPKEIKEDIHICSFHFNTLRQTEPVSMSLKEGRYMNDYSESDEKENRY